MTHADQLPLSPLLLVFSPSSPGPLTHLFPLQERACLQVMTAKQDKKRYNKTKQNPHIVTGEGNPVGEKESQE